MEQNMDQDEKAADPLGEVEKLEWEAPELLVEDVVTATRGGTTGDVHPVDDSWYS